MAETRDSYKLLVQELWGGAVRGIRVLIVLVVCVCGLRAQVPVLDDAQARQLAIEHPEPEYPPIAEAAHVWGDVVLWLDIDVDGRVTERRS